MAGAPVPGGSRGSMRMEGFVPPSPSVLAPPVASSGVMVASVQQQETVRSPYARDTDSVAPPVAWPDLASAPLGTGLLWTMLAVVGTRIHPLPGSPYRCAPEEWPVIAEYFRDWARRQGWSGLFSWAASDAECAWIAPVDAVPTLASRLALAVSENGRETGEMVTAGSAVSSVSVAASSRRPRRPKS